MGCGTSVDAVAVAGGNLMPDRQFMTHQEVKAIQERWKKPTIVLFGTGDAGKSTIFKQFRMMYDLELCSTESERLDYVPILQSNIIEDMKALITAAVQTNKVDLFEVEESVNAILAMDEMRLEAHSSWGSHIEQVWSHPPLVEFYKRHYETTLNHKAQHLLDNAYQIFSFGYVPRDEDIILARIRTGGVVEFDFEVHNALSTSYKLKLVDFGGQRCERKKWLELAKNKDIQITTIIYVVSLSEYDQMLVEDDTVNRTEEAVRTFAGVVNSSDFKDAQIVLLFNKSDLFRSKIEKSPLKFSFPTYNEPDMKKIVPDYSYYNNTQSPDSMAAQRNFTDLIKVEK